MNQTMFEGLSWFAFKTMLKWRHKNKQSNKSILCLQLSCLNFGETFLPLLSTHTKLGVMPLGPASQLCDAQKVMNETHKYPMSSSPSDDELDEPLSLESSEELMAASEICCKYATGEI